MKTYKISWPVRLTYYSHIFIEGGGALGMLLFPHLLFPEATMVRGVGGALLPLVVLAVLALRRPAELLVPASICTLLYHLIATALVSVQIFPAIDQALPIQWTSLIIHLVLGAGFAWVLVLKEPVT